MQASRSRRVLPDSLLDRRPPHRPRMAESRGLPEDPLEALANSGYIEKITAERADKNAKAITSYA